MVSQPDPADAEYRGDAVRHVSFAGRLLPMLRVRKAARPCCHLVGHPDSADAQHCGGAVRDATSVGRRFPALRRYRPTCRRCQLLSQHDPTDSQHDGDLARRSSSTGRHHRRNPRRPVGTRAATRPDCGSATVWGVALMALLMAVAASFAMVGAVRVARHKAYGAADLSALEAARLALVDPANACKAAAAVAKANGANLDRCTLTNEIADVWVSRDIELPTLGTRTVLARSRAGPT